MVEEAARVKRRSRLRNAAARKRKPQRHRRRTAKTSETNAANSAQAATTSQTASANPRQQPKIRNQRENMRQPAKTSETNAKVQPDGSENQQNGMLKPVKLRQKTAGLQQPKKRAACQFYDFSSWISNCCELTAKKTAKRSETNAKSARRLSEDQQEQIPKAKGETAAKAVRMQRLNASAAASSASRGIYSCTTIS